MEPWTVCCASATQPVRNPNRSRCRTRGSIGLYQADIRVPGVVFELSGWTKASRFYEYDPKTKTVVDTSCSPQAHLTLQKTSRQRKVKVPAPDGTLIPLSIIHRRGLKRDGSNPVLLNGYGAYGSSLDANFDPVSLAWLERGGVLAFAHVRGQVASTEDGWHKAGQKLTKPNTWRDFIACAEYLIEKEYTSPARLAGEGRKRRRCPDRACHHRTSRFVRGCPD